MFLRQPSHGFIPGKRRQPCLKNDNIAKRKHGSKIQSTAGVSQTNQSHVEEQYSVPKTQPFIWSSEAPMHQAAPTGHGCSQPPAAIMPLGLWGPEELKVPNPTTWFQSHCWKKDLDRKSGLKVMKLTSAKDITYNAIIQLCTLLYHYYCRSQEDPPIAESFTYPNAVWDKVWDESQCKGLRDYQFLPRIFCISTCCTAPVYKQALWAHQVQHMLWAQGLDGSSKKAATHPGAAARNWSLGQPCHPWGSPLAMCHQHRGGCGREKQHRANTGMRRAQGKRGLSFAIFLPWVNWFPLQISVDFNIILHFLPTALQKRTIREINS